MVKTFYYSALLFAFILPLSRAAISFFILWFVTLFIIRKNYRSAWEQIKNQRVFHAMGSLIALLFMSILWSADTHEALNQIRLYSYWIIIPILAVSLKKEWLPNIITAFLLGMFISEILAYGMYFELWTIHGHTSDYPSPIMFHIHYSIFLATTASILLSRLLSNSYTLRSKLPMFLFFVTSTGNLFISTGRTGQLAFLIAIAVTTIIHYRLTIKSLLIFITFSSILFIGAYSNINLFQKRINMGISDIQKLTEGNFDTSWGIRAAYWIISTDTLRENPLFGSGIGDYKLATIKALKENNYGFNQSVNSFCSSHDLHNQYLMILTQVGLIGFGLLIWMFIELFRLKMENADLKTFSLLSLTIFTVGSISESLWTLQFPIILFVFITSISLAASTKIELHKTI